MTTHYCNSCKKDKPALEFSNRAIKNKVKKPMVLLACTLCTQPPDTKHLTADEAKVVQQRHETKLSKWRESNGQVTGKAYMPHKACAAEDAPRLTKKIKLQAKGVTSEFVETFNIKTITVPELQRIAEEQLFEAAMEEAKEQPLEAAVEKVRRRVACTVQQQANIYHKIPTFSPHAKQWYKMREQLTDFGTTLRPDVMREAFVLYPHNKDDGIYPKGTMTDAPLMTTTRDLHFSSPATDDVLHVSSMSDPNRWLREEEGCVLVRGERGEIPVAARAPQQMTRETHDEFARLFRRLVDVRNDLKRGKEKASVKEAFVVLGYKLDRFTQQGIMHAGDKKDDAVDHAIQQM